MLNPPTYLDQLFDKHILYSTGVDGLYGRDGVFEDVIDGIERLVSRLGKDDGARRIHFPPGMNRNFMEKSGYLKSFPNLAGTVHSFMGNDVDHCQLLERLAAHEDWTVDQKATEVVLTPAACYPLYPTVAGMGPLPKDGVLYDLKSYCFRHEPSEDPARMQLFRMREYVRIGSAEQVQEFRQTWLDRSKDFAEALGLPAELDVANDPFFGRAGRMMANNQRDQGLKFELLIPVNNPEKPTACMSFNYHQDHFGSLWSLTQANGEKAHSACVGFGLERLALAMFKHHGLDTKAWPAALRERLWG